MTQLSGFHIMLPPGWSRYRVDDEGRKQFTSRLAARMKEVANPELDVRMRMLAAGRWKELEQSGTHSIYLADREVDGLAHVPISLAVRQHVAPAGVVFADGVQALTRAPVDSIDSAIGPILRWQGEKGGDGDTAGITTRTIGYGFAVPDADGRRGLVFTAAIPYPDGADPALIDGATELVDSIMETFRWR